MNKLAFLLIFFGSMLLLVKLGLKAEFAFPLVFLTFALTALFFIRRWLVRQHQDEKKVKIFVYLLFFGATALALAIALGVN